MEQQLSVLLYSNYSNVCKQLLSALQTSCPVDIYNITGLNVLCIDNEKIRRQIIQSKQLEITSVPTLLVIYGNSKIDKLEGQAVFDWIDKVVNMYLPQTQYQVPTQVHQPQINETQFEERPEFEEKPEFQEESEQKINQHPKKVLKKKVEFKHKKIEKPKSALNKKSTYIEDLDDEEEEDKNGNNIENLDENVDNRDLNEEESDEESTEDFDNDEDIRPPAGIRNGAGSFDLTNNFGKKEDRNVGKTSDASEIKSGLMAAALAMQKERE
jgi:hypothetical protein